MNELTSKLGTAETVLKLCELCRKYETEQEKVLPFFVPSQVRMVCSDRDHTSQLE
jgi:hypothetical protein